MRKACTWLSLLVAAGAGWTQTINPNQVRPSATSGQVLTTVTGGQPPSWATPSGTVFQHNGTNLIDQALWNWLDPNPPNMPAGYQPCTLGSNSSGGLGCWVPPPANGMLMYPAPPVSGQYAVIYPTACVPGASGSGTASCGGAFSWAQQPGIQVYGSGGMQIAVNVGPLNAGMGENTFTFAGALPSYISQSNVTAVYAFSYNVNSSNSDVIGIPSCADGITIGNNASITPPWGQSGVAPWGFQETLNEFGAVPGVDSITCSLEIEGSLSGASGGASIASVGLLVYYTGTAPPSGLPVYVLPPLSYSSPYLSLILPYNLGFDEISTNSYNVTIASFQSASNPGTPAEPGSGSEIVLYVSHANTSSAPTVQVNGRTYTVILDFGGGSLAAGDLASGVPNILLINGSNARLVNPHLSGGASVTWPTSADLVVSNGTNSPAGLAPVNGDCVVGSGGAWTAGACGNGTVTSVGMTVPSWLTVTGSPITTSGTLAVTATTGETANEFLATPNGSSGAVSLRAIAAADLPSSVVQNNQSNTYSGAYTQDFSGNSQVKLPVAAGYTSAANGEVGYDSTNHNWHLYANGADTLLAPLASGFVSGHCGQPTSSSGAWTIVDAGGACGISGGGTAFSSITSGSNTTATMTVGSGASLAPTGSGTIQATDIASTISAGTNVTISGAGTTSSPYAISASGVGSNVVQYNPSTTVYAFAGSSINADDSHVTSSAVAVSSWTCGGTTCTVTTSAAHNLLAGYWVQVSGMTGWFSAPTGLNGTDDTGYGSFQVLSTGLTSTQFEFNYSLNTGSGSGGNVYSAQYWTPYATSLMPFFNGHGSVYYRLDTCANDYTYFSTKFGSLSGTPKYLILDGCQDDIYANDSLSTIETALQNVWATAHANGWIVVQTSQLGTNYGISASCNTGTPIKCATLTAQLNSWLQGQQETFFNASTGKYWDSFIDLAAYLGPIVGSNVPIMGNTANGAMAAAQRFNEAFAHQGSSADGPPPIFQWDGSTTGGAIDVWAGTLGSYNPMWQWLDGNTLTPFLQIRSDWDSTVLTSTGGASAGSYNGIAALYAIDNNASVSAVDVAGFFGTGASSGEQSNVVIGTNLSANNNAGYAGFHYASSGSSTNYLDLGICTSLGSSSGYFSGACDSGTDGIRIYPSGGVQLAQVATSPSTSPVCPNGTNGTLTTSGCGSATPTPVPTVVDTTSTVTVSTSNAAEFHYNENSTASQAVTYDLPTAAAGKQFCFANAYNGSAANTGALTLQTSASGQYIVYTDGTLSASDGYVASGGAARDSACVAGIDSTHWMLWVSSGSWSKH